MQATSAKPPPYRIHHYPASLIDTRTLRSGRRLTLRPVLPQDGQLIGELVAGLSPAARRQRFHGAVKLSAARLQHMSCVDYTHHLALVVTVQVDGTERVVADARYCVSGDRSAEFALVVDVRWQGLGIGAWALLALQNAAATAGIAWLQGAVQRGNAPMLALVQRCGFDCTPDPGDEQLVKVAVRLGAAGAATPSPQRRLGSWLSRAGLLFQHPLTPRLTP